MIVLLYLFYVQVSFAVNLVSKIFKDFNYNWLARELELNLPQELDFEHEAANLNKCRRLLKDMIDSGDLALPEVANVSKRVLVMSFEEVRTSIDINLLFQD